MSAVGDALNKWLQRQNMSVMRQEATVCDRFPENTRTAMIDISVKSADKLREMGAPITHDYTLGKVITGTRERVPIPRPEGTIGTYHTHPFGWARPSTYDILDTINKDDKVMCIGASGKIGTKIQCFTPKEPKWPDLRFKMRLLSDDINDFNKAVGDKYRQRGIDLRNLLKTIGPERIDYVDPETGKTTVIPHPFNSGIALERRRQRLIDELNRQLLNMGYREEWRPQKKVNGWEAEPLMMDSCRIIWETIHGELPYEW